MEFGIDTLISYVPILVAVLLYSYGIYAKMKRLETALWKLIAWLNNELVPSLPGKPNILKQINPYEIEKCLYAEILTGNPQKLIIKPHSGQMSILNEIKAGKIQKIEIDSHFFYSKEYTALIIKEEQIRLKTKLRSEKEYLEKSKKLQVLNSLIHNLKIRIIDLKTKT